MVDFAREHDIPHDVCGKIITATDENELPRLQQILDYGTRNGLTDLQLIDGQQIKSPRTPLRRTPSHPRAPGRHHRLPAGGPKNGGGNYATPARLPHIVTGVTVTGTRRQQSGAHRIQTKRESYFARKLIFCAGLFADRLASQQGVALRERIVGFRGDYYELTPAASRKCVTSSTPCPTPTSPSWVSTSRA